MSGTLCYVSGTTAFDGQSQVGMVGSSYGI